MQIANRDVFPSDEIRAASPMLAGLLDLPAIDEEIRARDGAAIAAKRNYHRYGRLAISLIAISAIYTVAEALSIVPQGASAIASIIAVVFAAIGIGLQAILIVTRQKEKWLLQRFAVERLRSLKFQAFRMAWLAEGPEDLAARAAGFAAREVARLDEEIAMGPSVIRSFDPALALVAMGLPRKPANAAIAEAADTAYTDLRMTYQKRFALGEIDRMADRRRVFESSQDLIYVCAAVFALLALLTKGLQAFNMTFFAPPLVAWIDFLAVALFIAGASKAIMDNAGIEEQSASRYERYVRDIETITRQSAAGCMGLVTRIEAMERVALGELDLFCRAAARISYRL